MFRKEMLAAIDLLLPLLPMLFAFATKSPARRSLQEWVLMISIFLCAFMSHSIVEIADLSSRTVDAGIIRRIIESVFFSFFGNYLYPIVYFVSLTAVYWLILRPRSRATRAGVVK
ncbi:MAG: hypothetical protein R2684_06040 [Pyrinomonadaceae bacterium]